MKKLLIFIVICSFGVIMMGAVAISQAQKTIASVFIGNWQSSDNTEQGTCAYNSDQSKKFDDKTEKVRKDFEKEISGYFIPLALAMYQVDKTSTVDDIVKDIKTWDMNLSIDTNLQIHKYGNGYAEYLKSINEKHSLAISKRYFKEKYTSKDKEKRAYAYYLDVLGLLNDNCNVFVTTKSWDVPEKKPIIITQDYGVSAISGGDHLGIDMDNGFGADIYAVADGVIDEVGTGCAVDGGRLGNWCNQGQGNFIRLKVDDGDRIIYVVYMHLSTIDVKKGDNVTVGQVIAKQGHSGNSTASHLHLEFRLIPDVTIKLSDTVNPHEFIDFY